MLPTPQGYTVYLPAGGSNGIELRWNDRGLNSAIPCTFDASQFLADAGGDSIVASSVSITASPNTVTIGALQATGTALTWLMSGGVLTNPVADYAFLVNFTTVGGITVEETVWQRVWPMSPNQTFSTDLIIVQGPPGDAAQIVDLQALPNGAAGLLPTDTLAVVRNGVVYSVSAPNLTSGLFRRPSLNFSLASNSMLIPLL
jgi:hypothetical protein